MNTHFSVATHILSYLYLQPDQAVSSEALAFSVNTHAGFVRRLLVRLKEAGLTVATMGAQGGSMLARPGETITLLDIYRAVGAEGQVFTPHVEPNATCPVGRNILAATAPHFAAAEAALQASLSDVTLATVAEEMRTRIRAGA